MMAKLAEATADVDVYLVPANAGGGGRGGPGAPAASGGAAAGDAARGPGRGGFPQTAAGRHFSMANSAGYPAISVPHGFRESGSPAALTFYGQPFKETEIIVLAKAYQDASGFHLQHPNLEITPPVPTSNE